MSYAVDASGAEDIAATLAFAKERNIRFVIRNTGHDYLGRSTGAGALSVWTHHLKDTEVINWSDDNYSGKALKLGAGVQGFEALAAASEEDLVVVTGECPTVGLAGGYTQGGGHSALSTSFGLAADNTLEFEVVTPAGELITASRSENEDLYWALSGGGGGNFGVVVSMTVRAHPEAMVSGSSFSVAIPQDDPDKLYAAVDAFHDALPGMVDSGLMVIYFFGPGFFQSPAMTAYGKTKEEAQAIMKPFIDAIEALGLTIDINFTEFSSYHEHYNNYWGPLPAGSIGVGDSLFGGRLLPRSVLPDFSPTARELIDLGVTFIGVGLNVTKFGGNSANAVLPQWRETIVQVSLTLPWSFEAPFEEMLADQDRITNEIQPVIEAATPGAGAYMNEADFQQPDFQDAFFGDNYPKLLEVKKKYDPESLLYVTAGVGSEKWTVGNNGRMCKAKCQKRRS